MFVFKLTQLLLVNSWLNLIVKLLHNLTTNPYPNDSLLLQQEPVAIEEDVEASGRSVRQIGAAIMNELSEEPKGPSADDEGPASKTARHADADD